MMIKDYVRQLMICGDIKNVDKSKRQVYRKDCIWFRCLHYTVSFVYFIVKISP